MHDGFWERVYLYNRRHLDEMIERKEELSKVDQSLAGVMKEFLWLLEESKDCGAAKAQARAKQGFQVLVGGKA